MKNYITPILFFFCISQFSAQNNCIHFDGEDDFINFPGYNLQNDFTVSYWMKPDASNNGEDDRIIASGPTTRLEFGISDWDCDDSMVWIYDQTGGQHCFDINLRDGQWHQLALTIEGTTRTIFVDGIMLGTFEGISNVTFGTAFRIGQWTGGSSAPTYYSGALDEVRIWNYARTQMEIATTMNCTLDGDEEGLIAYWDFDQGEAGGNNASEEFLFDQTVSGVVGEMRNFAMLGSTSNFLASGAPIDVMCTPSNTEQLLTLSVEISPNPSTGLFQISAPELLNTKARVFDSKGALITSFRLSQQADLDLSNQAEGLYLLQIISPEGTLVKRILKL